jgi:hypothetical protein
MEVEAAAMPGPFPGMTPIGPADGVVHVIQVALTPVFLLSGIGTLLNVFNTRLSRVSDSREELAKQLHDQDDPNELIRLHAHLARLRRRTLVLDASIMFAAVGGAATCGAAMVLFLGSLREESIASWLFAMFGTALGCTIAALTAFLADSLLAWHWLHRRHHIFGRSEEPPS